MFGLWVCVCGCLVECFDGFSVPVWVRLHPHPQKKHKANQTQRTQTQADIQRSAGRSKQHNNNNNNQSTAHHSSNNNQPQKDSGTINLRRFSYVQEYRRWGGAQGKVEESTRKHPMYLNKSEDLYHPRRNMGTNEQKDSYIGRSACDRPFSFHCFSYNPSSPHVFGV